MVDDAGRAGLEIEQAEPAVLVVHGEDLDHCVRPLRIPVRTVNDRVLLSSRVYPDHLHAIGLHCRVEPDNPHLVSWHRLADLGTRRPLDSLTLFVYELHVAGSVLPSLILDPLKGEEASVRGELQVVRERVFLDRNGLREIGTRRPPYRIAHLTITFPLGDDLDQLELLVLQPGVLVARLFRLLPRGSNLPCRTRSHLIDPEIGALLGDLLAGPSAALCREEGPRAIRRQREVAQTGG